VSIIWYVLIPIVLVVVILFFGKPLRVKDDRTAGESGEGQDV